MAAPPAPRIDIHDRAEGLWETADELRINPHREVPDFSMPLLGLPFLTFARSRPWST